MRPVGSNAAGVVAAGIGVAGLIWPRCCRATTSPSPAPPSRNPHRSDAPGRRAGLRRAGPVVEREVPTEPSGSIRFGMMRGEGWDKGAKENGRRGAQAASEVTRRSRTVRVIGMTLMGVAVLVASTRWIVAIAICPAPFGAAVREVHLARDAP
jgi:hypothetical protein